MRFSRDLIKHSSIYGVGEILARMASLLLLPVYTAYLKPADYGVIAIIDLLTGLLAVVIGAGLSTAVSRFHFDSDDESQRSAIWWTGILFVAVTGLLIVLPCWLIRGQLAEWTLGDDIANGGLYYTLALSNMVLGCVEQIPTTYFRVRKWSGLYVSLAMFRLALNIALNLTFLIGLEWGVKAVLWGNLITGLVMILVTTGIFGLSLGRVRFDGEILGKLIRFGSPLIITAVLSMLMHYADRWLLKHFASLEEVGIYSLAYRVGQAVNQVILIPFAAIWGVTMYEIASQPQAKQIYARVYDIYVRGAGLLFFGASLFSRQLIALATSEEYAAGADLLPIICLGYLFFSLDDHFRVPVLLKKQTLSLVPVCCVAAVVNLLANAALIPLWGGTGAAWATVLTFLTYSGVGLYIYRRTDQYPYPFLRTAATIGGMVLSYLVIRFTTPGDDVLSFLAAGVVWLVWALGLFGRMGWDYWSGRTTDLLDLSDAHQNTIPDTTRAAADSINREDRQPQSKEEVALFAEQQELSESAVVNS